MNGAAKTITGDTLRALGKFEIDRKEYNVKATNAFRGRVRVKHGVKFSFDIMAKRISRQWIQKPFGLIRFDDNMASDGYALTSEL